MKQIKVSEATPNQLDWLVAKCEGFDTRNDCIVEYMNEQDSDDLMEFVCMADDEYHARDQLTDAHPESTFVSAYWRGFKITADWSFCGPIIEREKIDLEFMDNFEAWCGSVVREDGQDRESYSDDQDRESYTAEQKSFVGYGPTPLIAVCRCYVASKMGDVVEVPEELT